MTDLSKEQQEEVERLAEPAGPCEGQKESLKEDEAPPKKEEKLPKLSAADFRTYNSMAENMEYFVGICICFSVLVWLRLGERLTGG
jgi:hypothetical protein